MSRFKCSKCGAIDDASLTDYWLIKWSPNLYNWKGLEDYYGKPLCSQCGPSKLASGASSGLGKWHNKFPREFGDK